MHYMKPVQLRLPKEYIQLMDNLIKRGFYPNRNELIRMAVRDLFQTHEYTLLNTNKIKVSTIVEVEEEIEEYIEYARAEH